MTEATDQSRSKLLSCTRWFILFLSMVVNTSCDAICADTQPKTPSKALRAQLNKPSEVRALKSPTHSREWTLYARMNNAAFPESDSPAVAVHAPAGLDPRKPLHLVVFLHGYRGCVRVLMEKGRVACKPNAAVRRGWGLSEHHDAALTNSLLVIPQLAFMKRDGNPGCFRNKGCFRNFLQELLSETLFDRFPKPLYLTDIDGITLVAHSAGFETALAIVQHGEITSLVQNLVLMDALYAGVGGFVRWFSNTPVKRARIISIYLGKGKTNRQSLVLYRNLEREIGRDKIARATSDELKNAISLYPVVIATGRGPHGKVPENYLTQVLGALELPSIK